MYYYVPSPQSEPALAGSPFWERTYKDDAAFEDAMAKLNATDREVGQLLNHFRPLADDYVVAIDAATGAEKWHLVLPLRSPNLQTHKHRGFSGVPLVGGGTLYVPNLGGRLYAIDAASGKLKWESPAFKPDEKPQDVKAGVKPPPNPSPVMVGGRSSSPAAPGTPARSSGSTRPPGPSGGRPLAGISSGSPSAAGTAWSRCTATRSGRSPASTRPTGR